VDAAAVTIGREDPSGVWWSQDDKREGIEREEWGGEEWK
jgi:hypothetical protein